MDDRWQGWAATGGFLMLFMGVFKMFAGLIGLVNDQWIMRGFNGYYFTSATAVAWWYIIIGLLVFAAGLAVLGGKAWGRWVGVIVAGLAIISEFFFIPIYPIWAILLIVLYTYILIGLIIAKPLDE